MTDLSAFEPAALYDRYTVEIEFTEPLCGGVPKDPKLIEAWVKARTGHDDDLTKKQVDAVTQDLVDEVAEASWIGFLRDTALGLYIESRQVKAMLRECGSVLRFFEQKRGSKQVMQHGVEVKAVDADGAILGTGSKIPLGCDKPAGCEERPIHVDTPQGKRNALKRVDYVSPGTRLRFQVWILKTSPQEKRHLGEADLVKILTLGQHNGLGADRSQQRGKFRVVAFSRVAAESAVADDAFDLLTASA